MQKLRVLDLFSGIGGFSLGLERTGGFQTVAFCEIEPFCQAVLKKHWPEVPIHDDVRTLEHTGSVDVICGGYPCQPFSTAGKRKGHSDDRHLWPAMFSLIQKHRPAWVIGENVAGHISMGLDNVLSDLGGAGYSARTFVIPAVAVDAKHRRDRTWVVAYSDQRNDGRRTGEDARQDESKGLSERNERREPVKSGEVCATSLADPKGAGEWREVRNFCEADGRQVGKLCKQSNGASEDVANTTSQRQPRQGQPIQWGSSTQNGEGEANFLIPIRQPGIWPVEPNVGRVANGIPRRMDRLKALGNAVVPQVVTQIGYAILKAEREVIA